MKVYFFLFMIIFLCGETARKYSLTEPGNRMVDGRAHHSRHVRECFVIGALLLVFLSACRYNTPGDYWIYYGSYTRFSTDLGRSLRELDEPGIRLIYWIAVHIWDDGAACIFAMIAVILSLELSMVYRNTDQVLMSLVLFFLLVWDSCFNGMRQALATAVLCCGFRFLRERKFWPYLIVVALAYLCHKSAAIMLAVYPVCRREVNGRNWLILTLASIVVLFSADKVFAFTGWLLNDSTNVSAYYNNSYWTDSINPLRTAAYIVPAVFFGACYWKKKKSKKECFYLNLLLIHALVAVMTMNSTCLGRISMYTSPYLVIAIPELLKRFERTDRQILSAGIVTLYTVFWWVEARGTTWHWVWNR